MAQRRRSADYSSRYRSFVADIAALGIAPEYSRRLCSGAGHWNFPDGASAAPSISLINFARASRCYKTWRIPPYSSNNHPAHHPAFYLYLLLDLIYLPSKLFILPPHFNSLSKMRFSIATLVTLTGFAASVLAYVSYSALRSCLDICGVSILT